jgi:hypothetical protein
LSNQGVEDCYNNIDWNEWLYGDGASPKTFKFNEDPAIVACNALADAYVTMGGDDHPANWEDAKQFDSMLNQLFV